MSGVSPSVDKGLPVRLSACRDDRHWDAKAVALSDRIDVLLNGVTLDEIESYDVEAGEVFVCVHDESGRAIVDARGLPATNKRKGRVEVRWRCGEADAAPSGTAA